jgi:hypothetical protein
MLIAVHTHYLRIDPLPATVPAQYPQVVPAATTNLADPYPPPAPQELLQTFNADPVTTQPGIDKIQFLHVPLNIRKRNIIPIE